MINKFKDEVPSSFEYATLEQFKKVLSNYTLDENEILNFWGAYQIDNKFFFEQYLM